MPGATTTKLLLTHVPLARRHYCGARALARLRQLVEVVLGRALAGGRRQAADTRRGDDVGTVDLDRWAQRS